MPSSDEPVTKLDTDGPNTDFDHSDTAPTTAGAETVEFYWRPGCGFCMGLERALERAEVPLDKRNIWDDPAAAAFVRSVTGGNETVPTVRIGSTSLVNPSATDVATVIAAELPALASAMSEVPEPSPISKLLHRLIGG